MFADLAWLQDPPADFRAQLRAVRAALGDGAAVEERLHELASTRLDLNQLGQLATTVAAYRAAAPAAGPLARVRLGLIGSGTLGMIEPAIVASALRHRVLATVVGGDYGSAVRDAIDPASAIRTAGLDLAMIALDHRTLGLDRPQLVPGAADAAVAAAADMIAAMIDGLAASTAGGVMVATVVAPPEPLFGSFDAVEAGSVAAQVTAFNARLADFARARRIVLVDIARVAATVGLDRWHDAGQWHAAKLPFDPDLVPLYGDVVARTLAAIRGTTRKCLVLDLDNTLWGGVIGDDGVDGIKLGQGSASGEAFVAVQHAALALRERGVVLAVCSKNDDDVARQPFRDHPDMPLKETDIAAFVANWGDKATNLRAIAAALNIGLDALVFLDDNPVERAQVRRELPMVAVPELPADPALYPRALLAGGWFEAVAFAQEDRQRADQYRANAERAAFAGTSDMAGYLASLDMAADFRPFDAVNRARIAQIGRSVAGEEGGGAPGDRGGAQRQQRGRLHAVHMGGRDGGDDGPLPTRGVAPQREYLRRGPATPLQRAPGFGMHRRPARAAGGDADDRDLVEWKHRVVGRGAAGIGRDRVRHGGIREAGVDVATAAFHDGMRAGEARQQCGKACIRLFGDQDTGAAAPNGGRDRDGGAARGATEVQVETGLRQRRGHPCDRAQEGSTGHDRQLLVRPPEQGVVQRPLQEGRAGPQRRTQRIGAAQDPVAAMPRAVRGR